MTRYKGVTPLPELKKVVEALEEGKTIQRMVDGVWRDQTSVTLENSVEEYRVKPKPRELWVVYNPGYYGSYSNGEDACYAASQLTDGRFVKFVEEV